VTSPTSPPQPIRRQASLAELLRVHGPAPPAGAHRLVDTFEELGRRAKAVLGGPR
jgi:hypothetical protein